ncbi:MAG: hypothetical protein R3C44_14270 [Chloroflexota bacterium]
MKRAGALRRNQPILNTPVAGSTPWFIGGLGVPSSATAVFGFPAYALFILLVRPGIWREWRTILTMIGFALLGLAVWLCFPIRSAMVPPFGPSTMNTLSGFLDHVLARGAATLLLQPGRHPRPADCVLDPAGCNTSCRSLPWR